jgi:hypothetical protein
MASKREQILSALHSRLETLETAQVKVHRNLDKPQKVVGGLIIMRDGESDEPEVLLSPLTYIFEHPVPVEILVQDANPATRDSLLDALLVAIGGVVTADRTLGGLAEWVEANAPAYIDEPIEGAASVKMAQISITVRFFTSDPLN